VLTEQNPREIKKNQKKVGDKAKCLTGSNFI
jgi:hypothetical protein